MLGSLTIAYLFFGGTGAGAIAAACLLDVFWVHDVFGPRIAVAPFEASAGSRVLTWAFIVGLACLAAGCACLLSDLGRIDRALSLFESPSMTYLTFGSIALAALMACAAFLFLVRLLYLPALEGTLVFVVELFAALLSLAVMLYTGLLLRSLNSVSAWDTPLIPVLFVLSSASCGIAAVLVCAFFDGRQRCAFAVPRALLVADAAIIVLEIVAAVAFCLTVSSGVSFSAVSLGDVSLAALWWAGFVLCGLVVPLVFEAAAFRLTACSNESRRSFFVIAIAAALVIAGGVCLRFCIVNAGDHDALELSAPVAYEMQHPRAEGEWIL